MARRFMTTVASVAILGAGSLGFKDDHRPLDVQSDVVSISEIRPLKILSPKRTYTESLKRKLNKLNKSRPRPEAQPRFVFSASRLATPSQARVVGFKLAKARGWAGAASWAKEQWQCLKELWQRESGWKVWADNPRSDAYGIPQALPGEKMAVKGRDWRWNPWTQIKWGLWYIKDRYLTPCWAWLHFRRYNWY